MLSGFVNGIFLLFVVVEIISESFERLFEPQKVIPEKMILVSTLGLGINILGLFFFHEHSHFHSEEDDHEECSETALLAHKHDDHDHHHNHKHHDHDHHHDHHHHDRCQEDHHHDHDDQVEIKLIDDKPKKHAHNHNNSHKKSHDHHHNHNLAGIRNQLSLGVYLHILADALGSVACIISAGIIYFYEFYLADPITSLIISMLILLTTINLLKDTSHILLF